MPGSARFTGLYLFVRDLTKSLDFYQRLGFETESVSDTFARIEMANGMTVEMGTDELTHSYDPEWTHPPGPGTATIQFQLESRAAVDSLFTSLVEAGYHGHLAPCDAPWRARFAIIEDPDGNPVGLHSPRTVEADRQRERAG